MGHSTRSRSGSHLLSLALLLATATSVRADTEAAKMYFSRAETAYRLGKYKEAISGYESAYKEMPSAAFLFNIAQSYRQQYNLDKDLANLQKALALYKSYLREASDPPNRTTVLKLIDELKELLAAVQRDPSRQPAELELLGEGPAVGADVTVDGKAVGAVPVTAKVSPGGHFVRVYREGFRPWSQTVSLPAGAHVQVSVTLLAREAVGSDQPQRPASTASKPLYKRWWFWTIVGAVVTAGAGTAIYFAARDDPGDGLLQIDLRP